MDDFNNNVFGGDNGGFSSPFAVPSSVPAPDPEPEESPVVEEPAVEESAVDETAVEHKEEPEEAKPARRSSRKRSASRRSSADSAIPWHVVRKVLDAREKLEIVDDSTRKLAASLLNVSDETDESKFILALLTPEKVEEAKKSLSALLDTYDMNDLEFGMSIGSKTHAERKALYELEEAISPDKAAEVTNGRFPSNNPMEEVSIIRRIQKETNGFKEAVTSVNELLG